MNKTIRICLFALVTALLVSAYGLAFAAPADVYVKEGKSLIRQGRYSDAIESFQRALDFDPDNRKARFGLQNAEQLEKRNGGKTNDRRGRRPARQPEYERPAPPPQYQRPAPPPPPPLQYPQQQNQTPQAPAAPASSGSSGSGYIKIITSPDGEANDLYRKGNSYMKKKKYEKAVEYYKKAVEANPKHAKSYLNMGIAYKRMEKYTKATVAYSSALNIDPNYDKAYFNRAVAYKLLGKYNKAAADFNKTLQVNPGFKQAKTQLAALGSTKLPTSKDNSSIKQKAPNELLKDIPLAATKNPDAIAVVIGNRDYKKAKPVEFAFNDAWAMKQYLIDALGYKEGNIFFLKNASQSDFTQHFGNKGNHRGKLFNAVKEGKSDVFVYYSGHGAPGLKDHKGYFVPVEADPNYIELGGYPADVFYENLSKIPARNITVVLEACFSGASIFENISPMVVEVENPVAGLKKGVVLSSSSGSQVSSWYNEKGHSMFTYFFLKGLQSANADMNSDGSISFEEIYGYISDKTEGVPYYARRIHGVEQNPTLEGQYKGKTLVRY